MGETMVKNIPEPVLPYRPVPDGAASESGAPAADRGLPPPVVDGFRSGIGVGFTGKDALLGCLGEAAELASSCHWGEEGLSTAAFAELHEALHPDEMPLFSERHFALRGDKQAARAAGESVPRVFDRKLGVEWIECASLAHGRSARILAESALIVFRSKLPGTGFCIANSNGCAVAHTLAESVVRGFLELVERDATGIWWYGRHPRPEVDSAEFDEIPIHELRTWFHGRRRRLRVFDLTTDLGIPVRAALASQDGLKRPQLQGRGVPQAAQAASAATEPRQDRLDRCLEVRARHGLDLLAVDLGRPQIGIYCA